MMIRYIGRGDVVSLNESTPDSEMFSRALDPTQGLSHTSPTKGRGEWGKDRNNRWLMNETRSLININEPTSVSE